LAFLILPQNGLSVESPAGWAKVEGGSWPGGGRIPFPPMKIFSSYGCLGEASLPKYCIRYRWLNGTRSFSCFLLLAAAMGVAGCKNAQVTTTSESAPPAGLSASGLPPTVYVASFATSAAQVQVDPGGPLKRLENGQPLLQRQRGGLLSGLFNPQADKSNPYQTSSQVSSTEIEAAGKLQKDLVGALLAAKVPASVATNFQAGQSNALLLTGQFLTINEGDKLQRMAIGLGVGASYLETQAQLRDLNRPEDLPMLSFTTKADSGNAPGAAVSGGAGAAAGGVAAVGAGVSGFRASRTGTDADVQHTAGQIADYIKQYYQKQGWLPPDPPPPATTTPTGPGR